MNKQGVVGVSHAREDDSNRYLDASRCGRRPLKLKKVKCYPKEGMAAGFIYIFCKYIYIIKMIVF